MEALSIDQGPNHGEITIKGQQFFCDHQGALYWPKEECLIVSDLHLEKGAAMAARGVFSPPYDTSATLARLENCIAHWQPRSVICLGDSFHKNDSADDLLEQHRTQIRLLTQRYNWIWVTGNHDPDAPACLGGESADDVNIGQITFRHEQLASGFSGEISGHLHPAAKLLRRGKQLRRRCFASDGERLIMPAFGAFTGGLDLSNSAFEGMFDQNKLHIWMLGRVRVYEISASSTR